MFVANLRDSYARWRQLWPQYRFGRPIGAECTARAHQAQGALCCLPRRWATAPLNSFVTVTKLSPALWCASVLLEIYTTPTPNLEIGYLSWGDMGTRIVVVEDEQPIAEAVAQRLRSEGFEVKVAGNGTDGLELCQQWGPDLVVLDLMLPGVDGLEVCRRLNEGTRTPVIMLTARDDEADLLVGLALGADDYVTKPFSPRELVARIKAVLRRVESPVTSERITLPSLGVELETSERRTSVHGTPVHLTPTEFDLVVHLAQKRGSVLTREQLLNDVWGYEGEYGARTVDSHVRAVRRKLGEAAIRTVHSVGYAIGDVG